MNLEQYKAKKLSALTSQVPMRKTCYRCWKKTSLCICSSIDSFNTNTEIILLMHPKEAKKQKLGTGRMTLATLENSRMFSAVNFDHETKFMEILEDPNRHVVLVYPAPDATPLDAQLPQEWKKPIIEQKKTLTLLLIDATWPCAKKMMKLSSCLHNLPTASFSKSYEGKFVIKHQPNKMCLSTIETLIHALKGLQSMGIEDNDTPIDCLWTPFKEMLSFQIKCAEDPSIPSNRGTKSKKSQRPTETRVREKKNRLFYWDLERSGLGDHHKKG